MQKALGRQFHNKSLAAKCASTLQKKKSHAAHFSKPINVKKKNDKKVMCKYCIFSNIIAD